MQWKMSQPYPVFLLAQFLHNVPFIILYTQVTIISNYFWLFP